MESDVRVTRDVPVPMRDGVLLRADVWSSVDGAPRPVLLQRTPYDKGSMVAVGESAGLAPLSAVAAGYIVAIQDVRGRHAGGGDFAPFEREFDDGEDSIEWAKNLPGSSGEVGLYGSSYAGLTQLQAAARRPAGLQAIAPWICAPGWREGWNYQGGAFQLGLALSWALTELAPVELERLRAKGEGVASLQASLLQTLADPWSSYLKRPLTDIHPLECLVPAYREWALRTRSELPTPGELPPADLPGLHLGGWYDPFLHGTLATFTRMRRGVSDRRQRLVVGPWTHENYGSVVGDLDFGPAAGRAAIGPSDLHLEFFDEHIKHRPPAMRSSPIRLFLMGACEWRDRDSWPPEAAAATPMFLAASGGGEPGELRFDVPATGPALSQFAYDPEDPVPTRGGSTLLAAGFPEGRAAGPLDQRELEARHDVLVFRSASLARDTEVTGPIGAVLWVSTDGPDTDFTAKLVDVYPDGREINLADGILRMSHRGGSGIAAPIEPGEVYRIEIDLGATSNLFRAAHRVGLHVSSSNFPRFDRNPNTGGSAAVDTRSRVARQRVFHTADRPSHLSLPIVRRKA